MGLQQQSHNYDTHNIAEKRLYLYTSGSRDRALDKREQSVRVRVSGAARRILLYLCLKNLKSPPSENPKANMYSNLSVWLIKAGAFFIFKKIDSIVEDGIRRQQILIK